MNATRNIIALAIAGALALSVSAQAQTATGGDCIGYPVQGTAEIAVEVQGSVLSLPSGRRVLDYAASLGPGNSQESVCYSGDSTLVYTLTDSSRYVFREIEFEMPFGYEPAASPFKLWTVMPQSVVVHVQDNAQALGQMFKYTIKVLDSRTGALISIDPEVGCCRPPD